MYRTPQRERTVLKADEDREIRRILRKFSAEVGRVSRQVNVAMQIFARFDLITAKAKYSRDFEMSPPDLNTEGRLWLRSARHPLLEHFFRHVAPGDPADPLIKPPKKVVPIEVRLGIGFNILVITGPNTGGKTVALKTVGLLAMMAQSGLHIPATEGSAIPIFDHILADIGDEQSLEQSLSTFSSHISRIASIFEQATDRSLILFDELGAGTDPTEGAALGRAILDQLGSINCRAMVTTHLGDLKTYAFSNKNAENGAVEFDIETLEADLSAAHRPIRHEQRLEDRPSTQVTQETPVTGAEISAEAKRKNARTDPSATTSRRSGEGQDDGDGSPT